MIGSSSSSRIARIGFAGTLATVLAFAGGCSGWEKLNPFREKQPAEPEVLSAAQWGALKQENAARLAGEGLPGRAAAKSSGNVIEQTGGFFEFVFWTFPKRLYDQMFGGQTPARYARLMEDDQSADNRRTGVLKLVADYEFARGEPYTNRYWQVAQGDPDGLVRAAGIRALNRSRDRRVVPIAIKGLDDQNAVIRLEAAKALANIPDPTAVAVLSRHLPAQYDIRGADGRPEAVTESRDVRLACADALRNYPDKDVATRLVAVLNDKDFEVAWQARQSLRLLTGRDFRYDQEKWREYLLKSATPFG
ncbi:MAG TPA: HEAT repeat domain-containing protein [Tepidisphaeraceae bacterium]|nr:HEAT repeat domain-containing protein [Tepidisphaeraceae bacterium]